MPSALELLGSLALALGLGLVLRRLLDRHGLSRALLGVGLASASLAAVALLSFEAAAALGLLLGGLALWRDLPAPSLPKWASGARSRSFEPGGRRLLRGLGTALLIGLAYSAGMALLFVALDPSAGVLEATGGMAGAGLVFGGTLRPLGLADRCWAGQDRLFLHGAVSLLPVDPRRLALEAMGIQMVCGGLAILASALLGSSLLEPMAMAAATLVTASLVLASFLGHPRYVALLASAVLATLAAFFGQAFFELPAWLVVVPGGLLWLASLSRLRAPARPS